MTIRPVETKFFRVDRRRDRTDTKKLVDAFRNFATHA